MKTRFFDRLYVRSHFRLPKGRGSWAFQLSGIDYHDGEGLVHFTPSMTLTQAKAWVKPIIVAEALRHNADAKIVDIDLLP